MQGSVYGGLNGTRGKAEVLEIAEMTIWHSPYWCDPRISTPEVGTGSVVMVKQSDGGYCHDNQPQQPTWWFC